MRKYGYVIRYGDNDAVFTTESVLVTALKYIMDMDRSVSNLGGDSLLPTVIYRCRSNKNKLTGMNILDESSFQYKVVAHKEDGSKSETFYIPEKLIGKMVDSLHEQGYVTEHYSYCCPVLDHIAGVRTHMKNPYNNGTAKEWDIEELDHLCDKLLHTDDSQEGFVRAICEKVSGNQSITEAACQEHINHLKHAIAAYEKQEGDHDEGH